MESGPFPSLKIRVIASLARGIQWGSCMLHWPSVSRTLGLLKIGWVFLYFRGGRAVWLVPEVDQVEQEQEHEHGNKSRNPTSLSRASQKYLPAWPPTIHTSQGVWWRSWTSRGPRQGGPGWSTPTVPGGSGVGGRRSKTHRDHPLPDVPWGEHIQDHILHGCELAQGASGDHGDQVPEMN